MGVLKEKQVIWMLYTQKISFILVYFKQLW